MFDVQYGPNGVQWCSDALLEVVKSHPTLIPGFASNDDPSDGAETGVAELHIAEQSRSWRAAIGERKIMRGS